MPDNLIKIDGHLETVQQAKDFLSELTQQSYQAVSQPYVSSSAGSHMRHIADHYLALKAGLIEGVVNYNTRNRSAEMESCPDAALKVWQDIELWLKEISELQADMPLLVICETSVKTTTNAQTQSTLARELAFVSSHAVHHFSLLAVINSLLGLQSETNFGVAPNTATYIRQQA